MRAARPPDLRRRVWRLVRIGSGSILLTLGVAGLVLPFLQGIVLILSGLAVLATELPWARRWLNLLRGWLRRLRRKGGRVQAAPGKGGGRDGGESGQAG